MRTHRLGRVAARAAAVWAAALAACAPAPPLLERVEPPRGLTDRRTPIALIGRSLAPQFEESSDGVRTLEWSGEVGGRPLEVVRWISADRIEAVVPPGLDAGVYDVEVRTSRDRVRLRGAFTAVVAVSPRIDSATPERIEQSGTSVVLRGIGFHLGTRVTVNGVDVAAQWVSDQVLTWVAPPGVRGAARVEVSTPVGSAWRDDLLSFAGEM